MASPPLSFELYSVVFLGFVSVLLRDPWRVGECNSCVTSLEFLVVVFFSVVYI